MAPRPARVFFFSFLFFGCAAIFLDYSAFGREAGPKTTFGEKNRVFKEQAPPPPPCQEAGTQETPWGREGAAASSSSHDPASAGHGSVAGSLLTSLLAILVPAATSWAPGVSEPTRMPAATPGHQAGQSQLDGLKEKQHAPSVNLPAC